MQPSGFDERFDGFWRELLAQNPQTLLGARDRRWLRWHFAAPMRAGAVRILTASRAGLLRAYCVLVYRDHRHGVRGARLVDFQSVDTDRDLLPALLRVAVRRCVDDGIATLEHLGTDLPKTCGFDRVAVHRRKRDRWPYYYHAPDAALEATLSNPEVWDPSEFDGAATLS